MEESVSDLESRLHTYQQENLSGTKETTSSLSQVNETINKAFREIRFAQSNLETLLEQISTRVANLELQMTRLQRRVEQLDNQAGDNFTTLSERVSAARNESQQTLAQEMDKFNREINSLSADIKNLDNRLQSNQSTTRQEINTVQSLLNKRISALESDTKTIYEKILKELDIPLPSDMAESGHAAESYSGRIHIVVKGDSLSGIASKYNVSVNSLQELNGIENPSRIVIGQRIRIPGP